MKQFIQIVFSTAFAGMAAISADAQAARCWKTAESAAVHKGPSASDGSGFRMLAVRRDALTGSQWALVETCGHPEWPLRALKVEGMPLLEIADTGNAKTEAAATVPQQPIVIHAGDVVQLTAEDDHVRVQVTGMAEQSARVGEPISVRVERSSVDEGMRVEHMHGVASGPGAVTGQLQ